MQRIVCRHSAVCAIVAVLALAAGSSAAVAQARDLAGFRASEARDHSVPALTALRDQLLKQTRDTKLPKDPKALKDPKTLKATSDLNDLKAHLQRLNIAIDALQSAENYRNAGAPDLATAALADGKKRLTPENSALQEKALLLAIAEATTKDSARHIAETDAWTAIDRGHQLIDAGRFADAAEKLKTVPAQTNISDNARLKAQFLLAEANRGRENIEDHPILRSWASFSAGMIKAFDSLSTLAGWVLILVALVVLLTIRNAIGMAHGRTVLGFSDQTADAKVAGANPLDDGLAISIRERLTEISKVRKRASHMEERGTDEGTSVAALRPTMPAASDLSPLLQGTTTVQIGPVSFNPLQLLTFLQNLVTPPPARTLSGSLVKDGDGLLFVGRSTRQLPLPFWLHAEYEWRIRVPNQDALDMRSLVIADVAACIAFDLGTKGATTNRESFRAYQCALCLIAGLHDVHDPKARDATLKKAREELQRALDLDPENWMARFDLATLLRNMGEVEVSRRHLDMLRKRIEDCGRPPATVEAQPKNRRQSGRTKQTETTAADRLKAYIGEHPLFPDEVWYNLALAKMRLPSEVADAPAEGVSAYQHRKDHGLTELDKIGQSVMDTAATPAGSKDDNPSRAKQLLMLIDSARAAAIVYANDGSGLGTDEPVTLEEFRDGEADIEAARDRILNTSRAGEEEERVWSLAMAVAENAHGRLCTKRMMKTSGGGFGVRPGANRFDGAAKKLSRDAMDSYWKAVAYAPDFVDAYTNLAAHYLFAQDVVDNEWPRRAEEALLTALTLSPDSRLAHYQLGRLYMIPAVGRYDEAKQQLEAARPYVYSYANLGKIYLRVDGNYVSALDYLVRSLDLHWKQDGRLKLLAECLTRLSDPQNTQLPSGEQVSESVQLLGRIDFGTPPAETLASLDITKTQVDGLLGFLKTAKVKTSAAPPPPAAPDGTASAQLAALEAGKVAGGA